jgi:hypothetical protein
VEGRGGDAFYRVATVKILSPEIMASEMAEKQDIHTHSTVKRNSVKEKFFHPAQKQTEGEC